MERVKCAMCDSDLLVTDGQVKRFDVFACAKCYDGARLAITKSMPEGTENFFTSNEEFNLNGKPCGVSYMRAL